MKISNIDIFSVFNQLILILKNALIIKKNKVVVVHKKQRSNLLYQGIKALLKCWDQG